MNHFDRKEGSFMKGKRGLRVGALLCVAALGCALGAGCSGGEVAEPVYEDNKALHIGAWVAPPPDFISDETYKAVADSGINCIYALYEGADANAVKALELADKYGIKYLVRDWGLGSIPEEDFDLVPEMIEKYKEYPAFLGHLVSDEPGPNQFERLGALKQVYDKSLPGKLFYVNLFPTYSSLAQRDGRDYEAYINEYVEKVKPSVISYDHYPLLKNVDGTSVTEDYLLNLEIVSKAAKKAGIPFWNFIQTMSFGLVNRSPNYEDIRWQAYTTLAFGGQGIQHFCYWTPTEGTSESFGEAMIDAAGNKTPIYDYASRLNHELLKFDHVFLSYSPVGQMVWPKEGAPAHTYMKEPLESFAPVKSVEGGPVLMGCFEDKDGNAAIMLVNITDPGQQETVKVTVTFDGARALNVYTGGEKERVSLKGKKVELEFGAGEGKFIQILK